MLPRTDPTELDGFHAIVRLLKHVPALETLTFHYIGHSHDTIPSPNPEREPALLLSDVAISNLRNFRLDIDEVDNVRVSAFLHRHRRTLRCVEIGRTNPYPVRGDFVCRGTPSALLDLPKLERLVAPESYFRHLGESLTSATVIWDDSSTESDVEPVMRALDGCRDGLRELAVRRYKAGTELLECLRGRFRNLERLKIQVYSTFQDGRAVRSDLTKVSWLICCLLVVSVCSAWLRGYDH